MKALPCPFCGSEAMGRADGLVAFRPFYMRCSRGTCPGFNTSQGYADPEVALAEWNKRVQPPPEKPERVADLFGFTKKSLISGEMVCMALDRTGVLTSDAIAFSPNSVPLEKRDRI